MMPLKIPTEKTEKHSRAGPEQAGIVEEAERTRDYEMKQVWANPFLR
jgi:hypothetical protein